MFLAAFTQLKYEFFFLELVLTQFVLVNITLFSTILVPVQSYPRLLQPRRRQ